MTGMEETAVRPDAVQIGKTSNDLHRALELSRQEEERRRVREMQPGMDEDTALEEALRRSMSEK